MHSAGALEMTLKMENIEVRLDESNIIQKIMKVDLIYASEETAHKNVRRLLKKLNENKLHEIRLQFGLDNEGLEDMEKMKAFMQQETQKIECKIQMKEKKERFQLMIASNRRSERSFSDRI